MATSAKRPCRRCRKLERLQLDVSYSPTLDSTVKVTRRQNRNEDGEMRIGQKTLRLKYCTCTFLCSDAPLRTDTCGPSPTHGTRIVHERRGAQLGMHKTRKVCIGMRTPRLAHGHTSVAACVRHSCGSHRGKDTNTTELPPRPCLLATFCDRSVSETGKA